MESIEEFANSNEEVMRFGYYADHIKNWLKFYPVEQLHIVDANDLMVKPAHELGKIETFLGLEHELTDDDEVFSNNKVIPRELLCRINYRFVALVLSHRQT